MSPHSFGLAVRVLLVRLRFPALMVLVAVAVARSDDIRAAIDRALRPAAAPDLVGSAEHEFYCPMHPQVVRAAPGTCPICGMPLAKRAAKGAPPAGGDGAPAARVALDPARLRRAGVATARVERRPLVFRLEALGEVRYDERRLARISARTRGRIERLFVDYTGAQVERGAPLAQVLAPDVTAAAREWLLARKGGRAAPGDPVALAAEERLRLLGVGDAQLARIASEGAATVIEVDAPIAGTVIERKVLAGDWISEGQELYTVADLSLVWATIAIYEDEVGFVHIGAPVEVRAAAFPQRVFLGRVSFVEPALDAATRTVRARVDVPNGERLLKPGMAVRATLRIPIGPSGAPPIGGDVVWRCCTSCPDVVAEAPGACPRCGMPLTPVERGAPPPSGAAGDPFVCACDEAMSATPNALAAPATPSATAAATRTVYWCPMHPEVTQDAPGVCPKCGGMKLLAKEVPAAAPAASTPATPTASALPRAPLVVPSSAVVLLGRRAVVWREVEAGVYEAVEVVLGARVGEAYPIVSGLAEGDRVVSAGAFLVDAEARLRPGAGAYYGASGSPREGHEAHRATGGKP